MAAFEVEIHDGKAGHELWMEGHCLHINGDRPEEHRYLVTRHRDLAEEMARELGAWGKAATQHPSMVALHIRYIQVDRSNTKPLARALHAQLPSDWFFDRPADPALLFHIMAMLGTINVSKSELPSALEGLRARQLVAIQDVSFWLSSMLLGFKVVTGSDPLPGLAMGSCARHISDLFQRIAKRSGGLFFGDCGGGRVVPDEVDEDFCVKCCKAKKLSKEFAARCAVHGILDRARRYARFEEE